MMRKIIIALAAVTFGGAVAASTTADARMGGGGGGFHGGVGGCAMRPMAMTHDAVAVIRQFQVLAPGDKGIGFGDQRLSQHSAGALTCKFIQRIIDALTGLASSWSRSGS